MSLTAPTPEPAPAGAPEAEGLRARTVKGMAWTGGQYLLVRLLSLATFVVLARLLSPRDYGVAATATVFASLLALISSGGFSQALVQKPEIDKEDVDSVFWVSMSIGAFLMIVMIVTAEPIASFFRLPELKAVLWVLSPSFVAIAASSSQSGLMQRNFRFATTARIAVSANLLATVVGIAVAFLGAGYWALVVQTLIVPVYTSIVLSMVSGYRPGLKVSWSRYVELLRTSRQFMGNQLMTFTTEQSDKAVVGRVSGTAVLGVYSVAFRLVFIMVEVVTRSVQLVALPAFSRLQHDRRRLASGYLSVLRLCSTVSVPLFVYVGVCANSIVSIVFGDKWLPAVPSMQVFCVYGALQAIMIYHLVFLQAVGYARSVLWLAFGGTVVQVVAMIIAVHYGIAWVAASFALRAALMLPVMMGMIASVVGRQVLPKIAATVTPPVLASAAMFVVSLLVVHADRAPLTTLVVSLPVAVLTYVAALAVVGRKHLADLWHTSTLMRTGGRGRQPTGGKHAA